jgi:hypothetical protein
MAKTKIFKLRENVLRFMGREVFNGSIFSDDHDGLYLSALEVANQFMTIDLIPTYEPELRFEMLMNVLKANNKSALIAECYVVDYGKSGYFIKAHDYETVIDVLSSESNLEAKSVKLMYAMAYTQTKPQIDAVADWQWDKIIGNRMTRDSFVTSLGINPKSPYVNDQIKAGLAVKRFLGGYYINRIIGSLYQPSYSDEQLSQLALKLTQREVKQWLQLRDMICG